jgi:hypothetical protein
LSVAAPTASALEWLLASKEPAVRYLARRDVLGEQAHEKGARILGSDRTRLARRDLELAAGTVLDWLTGKSHRSASRTGRWQADGSWWRRRGSSGSNTEVVDWGRGPSEMITLNALRVLTAAGRL